MLYKPSRNFRQHARSSLTFLTILWACLEAESPSYGSFGSAMNSTAFSMLRHVLLSLVGLSLLVSAAPILSRRANNDLLVLKFADVLEQLESAFYSQAIFKFQDADFTSAGFISSQIPLEQFVSIQSDEQTHSQVLQAAIKSFGSTPITSCKFNFGSALSSVSVMAPTARIVETVGVAAYLGAAHLISNPSVLTTAGSILTVEARHQTILNVLSGTGSAIPSAFDIALSPQEVLAMVVPFFNGPCDLGVQANPTLTVTNKGAIGPGTLLTFQSPAINGQVPQSQLSCQMMVGGTPNSIVLPLSQCVVPGGVNGPVAIFITRDSQPLVNDVVKRTSDSVLAGPTIVFIDTSPQALGKLIVKGASGGSGSGDSVTRTVSPPSASSTPSATATGSGTAGAVTPTPSVLYDLPFVGTRGKQNDFVGESPNGIAVHGWKTVPIPTVS
ncbi:hypothetical protein APHAL10511_005614 [Amanita phalloides]|nr:hypothetical protein APHAL10511_005614 [Amanita phalloides]